MGDGDRRRDEEGSEKDQQRVNAAVINVNLSKIQSLKALNTGHSHRRPDTAYAAPPLESEVGNGRERWERRS